MHLKGKAKQFITNFGSIAFQAETIGGIENLIIQAAGQPTKHHCNGQLLFGNDFFAYSKPSSHEFAMTNVIVPLVVGLVEQARI